MHAKLKMSTDLLWRSNIILSTIHRHVRYCFLMQNNLHTFLSFLVMEVFYTSLMEESSAFVIF